MIYRRAFVLAFYMALLIAPTGSWSQTAQVVHRIAIIEAGALDASIAEGGKVRWSILLKALRQFGYVEGGNLIIDRRSTKGHNETTIAASVVASKPDLIVAPGSVPLLKAFLAATKTIPIVTVVSDPVILGFAASYARPGGNLTGLSAGAQLDRKRLELLKEVVPSAVRVGYLHRRAAWSSPFAAAARDAAQKLGITLVPALSDRPEIKGEYARIFAAMVKDKVDAVVAPPSAEHLAFKSRIVKQAALRRLPSIYCQPHIARAGGLMSYGPDIPELYRRVASYVDRILRGANPADLPIEHASKFDFVLNLKTAKALGITFPRSILLRATEVIE